MRRKSILAAIEDSASRRRLIEGLVAEQYEVEIVHTPAQAAGRIRESAVGLVIADISAPLLDSLNFLTYFKDKNPVGNIIVLSKNPKLESAVQAMRLYASEYLCDPVSHETLLGSVERAFFDSDKAISRIRAHAAEENLRLKEELEKANLDSITALANALEARDEYTRGHSSRVADLAARVGERMRLGQEDINRLRYGGMLHDIGKIGVDRGVLNKKSPLSRDEFDGINEHTAIGVKIVSPVDSLRGVIALIKHHHEPYSHLVTMMDPDSREFLLVCVIKAVDAFDAMVSDRPYRKAMPPEMAVAELRSYSGSEFHPRVVEEIAMVVRADKVKDMGQAETGTFFSGGTLAQGYL